MYSRRGGLFFFFQAEDGIRDKLVTGVQTCAFRSGRCRPWRRTRRPGCSRRTRAWDRAGSEERRVGKECRSRWSPYHSKKNQISRATPPTRSACCKRKRSASRRRWPTAWCCFFFPAEDGIRGKLVTGVQTCALPILAPVAGRHFATLAHLGDVAIVADTGGS